MDASVEAVDGNILLKFKRFLVEGGENEISVSGTHNFIYGFSDTVGKGHGSNRGKSMIEIIPGEVPAPPATGNDTLLDSNGKCGCSMLHLIPTLMLRMGH